MRLLILFAGQALNFLIAVVNMRAISKGRMWIVGATDFLFCLVSYVLIRKIAEAGSYGELLAYALGGTVGSIAAMWITRHWKD